MCAERLGFDPHCDLVTEPHRATGTHFIGSGALVPGVYERTLLANLGQRKAENEAVTPTTRATTCGGAQTPRLDLVAIGSLELATKVAHLDSPSLTGTGQIAFTIGGTDHHDLLDLAGSG